MLSGADLSCEYAPAMARNATLNFEPGMSLVLSSADFGHVPYWDGPAAKCRNPTSAVQRLDTPRANLPSDLRASVSADFPETVGQHGSGLFPVLENLTAPSALVASLQTTII